MIIRNLCFGFGLLALSAGVALAGVEVGQPAPDFSLPDTNGQSHRLSEYKGKYVVLEWYNPDCPFVRKHYGSGNMQALQKEFTAKGVVWLSIDSSAPGQEGNYPAAKLNEMASSQGVARTPLLLDPDGKEGHEYGAKTTPHMYIINPEGKLPDEGAIDNKHTTLLSPTKSTTKTVQSTLA